MGPTLDGDDEWRSALRRLGFLDGGGSARVDVGVGAPALGSRVLAEPLFSLVSARVCGDGSSLPSDTAARMGERVFSCWTPLGAVSQTESLALSDELFSPVGISSFHRLSLEEKRVREDCWSVGLCKFCRDLGCER